MEPRNKTWARYIVTVLGMAMLWPSIHNQLMYPATFVFNKDGAPPAYYLYFAYAAMVVVASLVIVANRRLLARSLFPNAGAMGVVGGLGIAGIALVCTADFSSVPTMLAGLLGFALTACSVPICFTFWCLRIVGLGDGSYEKGHVVAVSLALSYVVFCVLTALRLTFGLHARPVSIAFGVVGTLLSVVACHMFPQDQPPTGEAIVKQLPVNLVAPSLAFVYVCTLVIVLLNPEVALKDYPQQRAFLYWIDAALIGVCAGVFFKLAGATRRASMIVFAVLSVYLVGMVLLTALSAIRTFSTANFPIIAAKNAFDFFILLLILVGCHNRHVEAGKLVGLFLIFAYVLPSVLSVVVLIAGGVYTDPLEGSFFILSVMLVTAFVVAIVANVVLVLFLSRKGRLADADDNAGKPAPLPAIDLVKAAWGLTEREAEIVAAVCTNASTEKVARDLGISEATVYSHLKRIYRKSDAHSRQELIDLVETFHK